MQSSLKLKKFNFLVVIDQMLVISQLEVLKLGKKGLLFVFARTNKVNCIRQKINKLQ